MSKHTTLDQLKMLAQRTKAEIDQVESKSLVGIKVNGTALSIADKMVDILIATGTANGTVAVNGVDVAVKGLAALAYKAQVSEADLDTALKAVLDAKASGADLATLIGTDTGKSARTIANEELAAQLIPESAKDSLDTLTEIAQWIQDHPDDASAMNSAISKLQAIAAGIGGESDTYATVIAAIDGKIAAALTDISKGATKVEASETNGNIKIDGVETPVYTHPTTTAVGAGFKKVGNDDKGHVVLGADVTKQDIVALGIPAQDTTYSNVVAGGASGLMSGADKTKLDGIEVATDPEVESIPTQSGLEWALYPTASSGSQTTYVPDYWNFYGSVPCLYHGGYYSRYLNYGPFCVGYNGTSSQYSYIGCRLQERPPMAA